MDFSCYKSRDTGFTKTISQTPSLPAAEETCIQSQKQQAMMAFEEVKGALRNQDLELSNLTDMEKEGRKQVIRGIKNSGWHLSQTDKSKKLVLDLKDNYIKGLQKHTTKDTAVQLEDVVANDADDISVLHQTNHSTSLKKTPYLWMEGDVFDRPAGGLADYS